jgi:hypothetical protein
MLNGFDAEDILDLCLTGNFESGHTACLDANLGGLKEKR